LRSSQKFSHIAGVAFRGRGGNEPERASGERAECEVGGGHGLHLQAVVDVDPDTRADLGGRGDRAARGDGDVTAEQTLDQVADVLGAGEDEGGHDEISWKSGNYWFG
jgi:hypothetical protein